MSGAAQSTDARTSRTSYETTTGLVFICLPSTANRKLRHRLEEVLSFSNFLLASSTIRRYVVQFFLGRSSVEQVLRRTVDPS